MDAKEALDIADQAQRAAHQPVPPWRPAVSAGLYAAAAFALGTALLRPGWAYVLIPLAVVAGIALITLNVAWRLPRTRA